MKTYDAIKAVSMAMIQDNLCNAILLKGSIGRGDDDAYSDVDMYAIISEENMSKFMNKRIDYLNTYKKIIFHESVNFVCDQIVAIYEDGLHFDLYTTTEKNFRHDGKIKIIYDKNDIYKDYIPNLNYITEAELVNHFTETLYCFTEANGAYNRKNYPWASRIMDGAIENCAVLLRYIFDKEHAYLG